MKLSEVRVLDKRRARLDLRDSKYGYLLASRFCYAEPYMDCEVVSVERDNSIHIKLDHDSVVEARKLHGLSVDEDIWINKKGNKK